MQTASNAVVSRVDPQVDVHAIPVVTRAPNDANVDRPPHEAENMQRWGV